MNDEQTKAAEAWREAEDWSEKAGASAVDELILAGLLLDPGKNADWARRIVSQDLFIGWTGGIVPPEPPIPRKG